MIELHLISSGNIMATLIDEEFLLIDRYLQNTVHALRFHLIVESRTSWLVGGLFYQGIYHNWL